MRPTTTVLMVLLMLAGTSDGESTSTPVPSGKPPTIDGSLARDEWKDAREIELQPTGQAFLLQDEQALYVGLRVGANCIPSLCLLHGERILVLHASASLGTAEYERSAEAWTATRKFAWRCRGGQAADQERARFLAEEGWVATTTADGRPGEAEYRIERRLLAGGLPRIAVVACRIQPMPMTACAWPDTVRDDSCNQDLLFGKTPDLQLAPKTWARLDLGQVKTPAERFETALDEIEAESNPVDAYHALLDLLDGAGESGEASKRAKLLRKRLEARKEVAGEVKAQRRLEAALKLARKKLHEVAEKHPDTRAARLARRCLESLAP